MTDPVKGRLCLECEWCSFTTIAGIRARFISLFGEVE